MPNNQLKNYIQNNEYYKSKGDLLLENYKTQEDSLDRAKKEQQQSATISHQKLLKYLPEYNASMGLYGSGASETAVLDANARYRSQQGQIAANYNTQKAQAQENYNQNMLNLYSEAKAEQDKNYDTAYATVSGWTGSASELEQYKNGLAEKLSEDQYQDVLNQYRTKHEELTEKETNQQYQITDISAHGVITPSGVNKDFTEGDNFKLKVGERNYKVELGGAVSDQGVTQAAINSGVVDGSVFVYNGQMYYMNGSTIHRVRNRANFATGEYDELIRLLLGNNSPSTPQTSSPTQQSSTRNNSVGAETVFPIGSMR